jgi:hypothetical protein
MSIELIHHYIFYKMYKFWDFFSYPKFASDFKATVSMVLLETSLFACIPFYYAAHTGKIFYLDLKDIRILIPSLVIMLVNYMSFIRNDNWKKYMSQFDSLPKRKNILGSVVVLLLTITIFSNVIYSIRLFYHDYHP